MRLSACSAGLKPCPTDVGQGVGLAASVVVAIVLASSAALSQAPAPRWQRPAGSSRYVFTSMEQRPDKTSSIDLEVTLTVKEGALEVLTLERGRITEGGAVPAPIQLPQACAIEFGGRNGTLGRIELTEGTDPTKLVPGCVPEGLFGAVTDLVSILHIQSKFFGLTTLKAAGDSSRFPRFEVEWSRDEPAVHARIVAPGGTTKLASLEAGRAVVEWRPDPMDLAIARRVAPQMTVVMRGQEHFALEATIDPRTGALVSARSVEDRLDMRFWPVQGADMPSLATTPAGPGQPITLTRTISLTPAPAPAGSRL